MPIMFLSPSDVVDANGCQAPVDNHVQTMSNPTYRQLEGLPNEILLHAFSFFPLRGLIIGRTLSQDWRRLIPLADISPIRRVLLDFYLTLVNSPIFPQTRPWVLANLKPFDRQAYIDDLMRQHPYVPEAFQVWILEWPARAVIGCVWPGLPNLYSREPCVDNVHRMDGTNWLAPVPPTVCAIPFQNCTPEAEFIPALFIFHHNQATVWLMLDERGTLRDKVYTFFEGGNNLWDEDGSTEWDDIDADWIGWQRRTWNNIEAAARERAQKNKPILQLETMPPENPFVERWYFSKTFRRQQLQAHPWQQRDDPEVREALFFDEVCFFSACMPRTYGNILQNNDHVQGFGELIREDILLNQPC